jgi:hypothetical protein
MKSTGNDSGDNGVAGAAPVWTAATGVRDEVRVASNERSTMKRCNDGLCGAVGCPRCSPEHFDGDEYLLRVCPECGREWYAERAGSGYTCVSCQFQEWELF